jgi:hypothetical protein
VDPTRVALMGLSFGGALVPRAAAFERRLKIAIANPGVYHWHEMIDGFFAQIDPSLPVLAQSDPAAFDARIAAISEGSPLVRWGVKDTLWKHGARKPHEVLTAMRAYTNEGVAERIECETLVMDGTADPWAQGRTLYDALRCPKSYLLFDESDIGLVHCQTGALAVSTERTFGWLDERL